MSDPEIDLGDYSFEQQLADSNALVDRLLEASGMSHVGSVEEGVFMPRVALSVFAMQALGGDSMDQGIAETIIDSSYLEGVNQLLVNMYGTDVPFEIDVEHDVEPIRKAMDSFFELSGFAGFLKDELAKIAMAARVVASEADTTVEAILRDEEGYRDVLKLRYVGPSEYWDVLSSTLKSQGFNQSYESALTTFFEELERKEHPYADDYTVGQVAASGLASTKAALEKSGLTGSLPDPDRNLTSPEILEILAAINDLYGVEATQGDDTLRHKCVEALAKIAPSRGEVPKRIQPGGEKSVEQPDKPIDPRAIKYAETQGWPSDPDAWDFSQRSDIKWYLREQDKQPPRGI